MHKGKRTRPSSFAEHTKRRVATLAYHTLHNLALPCPWSKRANRVVSTILPSPLKRRSGIRLVTACWDLHRVKCFVIADWGTVAATVPWKLRLRPRRSECFVFSSWHPSRVGLRRSGSGRDVAMNILGDSPWNDALFPSPWMTHPPVLSTALLLEPFLALLNNTHLLPTPHAQTCCLRIL